MPAPRPKSQADLELGRLQIWCVACICWLLSSLIWLRLLILFNTAVLDRILQLRVNGIHDLMIINQGSIPSRIWQSHHVLPGKRLQMWKINGFLGKWSTNGFHRVPSSKMPTIIGENPSFCCLSSPVDMMFTLTIFKNHVLTFTIISSK